MLILIRAVADDQRALALGIQSSVTRTLGSVPGPLLFGLLFDVSCVLWQEECGRRGNCWVYDKQQLSYNVLSLGFPAISLALILFFLAFITFSKKKEEEEATEQFNLT